MKMTGRVLRSIYRLILSQHDLTIAVAANRHPRLFGREIISKVAYSNLCDPNTSVSQTNGQTNRRLTMATAL